MEHFIRKLLEESDIPEAIGGFVPVARYYPNMDFLLYLNEDCSFRAERVDAFLTVLWHPQEEKLVGLKLKGFAFIFERLRHVMEFKDTDFVPLVKALEFTLTGGMAERLMAKIETKKRERTDDLYAKARALAKDVTFPSLELKKAA